MQLTTQSPQAGFKINEACRYLGGLHQQTLRRLVRRGLLKPNRSLRHLLFSKAELDEIDKHAADGGLNIWAQSSQSG